MAPGSWKTAIVIYCRQKKVRMFLREGLFKKKTANYPLLWIRGGGPRMWIKKILNVNIINFEKVDKPEGGGVGQCG